MYDGTELEDVCNVCAAMRTPVGWVFFPEIPLEVWGTEVPLVSSASAAAGDGNSRCVVFVCYVIFNCLAYAMHLIGLKRTTSYPQYESAEISASVRIVVIVVWCKYMQCFMLASPNNQPAARSTYL